MNRVKEYIKLNKIELICVTFIVLTAFVLRMVALNNIGDLVLDEVYSWYFASRDSVIEVARQVLNQDVHMPLYFLILHCWIKIFGNSEVSLRLCSLACSLPLIPIAYYSMKFLFNKTAGYFVAIFLTFNTFCIYYSLQARFYSLVMTLTLLSSFLFVKLLEKFEKKYVISFVVVHCLLIYTFALTPILTAFYGVVGFSYVLMKKRNIKDFISMFLIIALLCLPVIVFTAHNIFILSSNLCSHAKEFFNFNWFAIYDILENFFSNENYQIYSRVYANYRDIFDNVFNFKYFILVFIPILICIWALIKGLACKNLRMTLFFLPSGLALIYILLLSSADAIYFQTKYLLLVFPVIICCCAFGLSLIRNKIVSVSIFSLLIYLNIMHLILNPSNVLNLHSVEMANLNSVMNNVAHINDDDILLIPFVSDKLKMYITKGELIPFSFDEALLLKDKNSAKFYFGEKLYKKLNKNNAKEELKDYILQNKIPIDFEKNLKDNYFENMKPGQKFILLSAYEKAIGSLDEPWNLSLQNYDSLFNFGLLMRKVSLDSKKLADENLKFIKKYTDTQRQYTIYVYEK